VPQGDQQKAVAQYVLDREDGDDWEDWLQTHRVELNAMTTPAFIAWLDRKMGEQGGGKLIPPDTVITAELEGRLDDKVRTSVRERVLREAGYEDQVAAALEAIKRPDVADLKAGIERLFEDDPERQWRDYIEAAVDDLSTPEGDE
jgi:hypothetical protein